MTATQSEKAARFRELHEGPGTFGYLDHILTTPELNGSMRDEER